LEEQERQVEILADEPVPVLEEAVDQGSR